MLLEKKDMVSALELPDPKGLIMSYSLSTMVDFCYVSCCMSCDASCVVFCRGFCRVLFVPSIRNASLEVCSEFGALSCLRAFALRPDMVLFCSVMMSGSLRYGLIK